MKKKAIIFLSLALFLTGCGATDTPLVSDVSKPENFQFETVDLEGIGTVQMPVGDEWEVTDGEYYNAALDMTIFTQSQPGNFTHQVQDITDGLIVANKRDAPGYQLIGTKEGTLDNIKAVRIDGKFNNGTQYITRDYIIITEEKVVPIMARIDEQHVDQLNPIIDYIVSTVEIK